MLDPVLGFIEKIIQVYVELLYNLHLLMLILLWYCPWTQFLEFQRIFGNGSF